MSLAISGVRPRQRRRRTILEERQINPGKGINVFVSEQFINDQEGSNAMNATLVESGAISKANGWDEVGIGLANAPRGLASYYPTGNDPRLLTVDGANLKYLNASIWTNVPGAVTFGASDNYDFVQAQGKLFIMNGVDAVSQLNNLTLTRPATTVSAGFGIYYADRMIVAGVAAHPNRLYISSPLDVADFTNANPTGTGAYSAYTTATHPGATAFAGSDANYLDVAKDDGDKITAVTKYQQLLIIFKERSIYSLEFDSTGNPVVKLVTNAIGCISHWTVDHMDNDVLFLSRKGYFVLGTEPNFFDQIRTNELSIRIKPYIEAITPANLGRSSSIFFDNVYYGASPTGVSTTNNRVFTYHRQYTGWLQRNDIQANSFTEFIDENNVDNLYYAHETLPKVYKLSTGFNHGSDPIDMYWESKAYDFGKFDITKRFVDVTLLFRQLRGSVDVTITIDGNRIQKPYFISGSSFSGGMGRALLGTALLGGRDESGSAETTTTTNNIPIRLGVGENGRTIKIRVANKNLNENFVLLGFNIGYRPKGRNTFPAELRVY